MSDQPASVDPVEAQHLDEVHLTTELVHLRRGDALCRAYGKVVLKLVPSPRLQIHVDRFHASSRSNLWEVFFAQDEGVTVEFPARGILFGVYLVRGNWDTEPEMTFIVLEEPVLARKGNSLKHAEAYLLNFIEFPRIGTAPHPSQVVLESPEWRVEVHALSDDISTGTGEWRNNPHKLTHRLAITRRDGGRFTSEAATDLLTALHHFFSFAAGAWTAPCLARGWGEAGEVEWEVWGVPLLEPRSRRIQWFDYLNPDSLSHVFPGFLHLWTTDKWREPLERAIYWYLRSNSSVAGLDGSIILTQAALELLAWVLLVEDKRALMKSSFKNLPAADQMRVTLVQQQVPLECPESLPRLIRLAKEFNWDGPAAFVEIRNSIVHPGHKHRQGASREKVYNDIWNLGQNYVELILLSLFGYNGVYVDRIKSTWAHDVSRVPWIPVE